MANLTLKLLLAVLPLAGGKKRLAELFRVTAAAFGRQAPDLHGLSRREMLRRYAQFTRAQAEESMSAGSSDGIRKKLFDNSRSLARDIRRRLPIRSRADETAVLRFLYRSLDIDKQVDAQGAVRIRRCFFASQYSPEVCRFMAAMDEGMVAGICGGRLVFSQRLTEGAEACRGLITWPQGADE
jgi:hypothetical protein